MSAPDEELQEIDVPAMAIEGLKEAQRRAVQKGLPVVFVRGRELVRSSGGLITVLKKLPARKKVKDRQPKKLT